jgi:site-specific DNA recombinase
VKNQWWLNAKYSFGRVNNFPLTVPRDETGDWLTPTHTTKAGRRHRYYVSHRLIAKGTDPTGWRLPAQKLETTVVEAIADHLETATSRHQLLATPDLRGNPDVVIAARMLTRSIRKGDTALLSDPLTSGVLGPLSLKLTLDRDALANRLGIPPGDLASDLHHLTAEVRLRRRSVEVKLIVGDRTSPPDPVLLRTLDAAHRWTKSLSAGVPLADIAREAGHHNVIIRTRAQLAYLSPKIQRAICDGQQPTELTLQRILTRPVPLDWKHQERLYGFD